MNINSTKSAHPQQPVLGESSSQEIQAPTTKPAVVDAGQQQSDQAVLIVLSSYSGGDVEAPHGKTDPEKLGEVAQKDSRESNKWVGSGSADSLMGEIMALIAKVMGILIKAQQSSQESFYQGAMASFKISMAAANKVKESSTIVMASTISAAVVGGIGLGASGLGSIKSVSEAGKAHQTNVQLSKLEDSNSATTGLAAVGDGAASPALAASDGGNLSVDLSKQRQDLKLQMDGHTHTSEKYGQMAEISKSTVQVATQTAQGVGESQKVAKDSEKQELEAEGGLRQTQNQDQERRWQKMQELQGKAEQLGQSVVSTQRQMAQATTR